MIASPQVFRCVAAGTAWLVVGTLGVCLIGGDVMADPPLVSGASVDEPVVDTGAESAPRPSAELIEAALQMKSTDKVEDLLALHGLEFYDRLALWLLGVQGDEIAALWKTLGTREELDEPVREFLFDRWTRIDPAGAVDATQGTDHYGAPWTAWARHDPDAAIAHTKNFTSGDEAKSARFPVIIAISRFHPERVLEVLEQHPEFDMDGAFFIRENALRRAEKERLAKADPEEALEAMRKDGWKGRIEPLERWAGDDPGAVLEWVLRQSRYDQFRLLNCLLDTLRRDDSPALSKLAARQPPGRVRRLIESSRFRALVDDDPDAALEEALATEAPRLAAERLAQVGIKLVAGDPDRAFMAYDEMLDRCPIPITVGRRIYSGGSATSGMAPPGEVLQFEQALVDADPERALAIAVRHWPGSRPCRLPGLLGSFASWSSGAPGRISMFWARLDIRGFSRWVSECGPDEHRDSLAGVAAKILAERGCFAEALDWVEGISDEKQLMFNYESVLLRWVSKDRAAAEAWFEQADLSDETRDRLQRRCMPRER